MSTTQTTEKAEARGSLIYCIQRGWANTECEEMARGLLNACKKAVDLIQNEKTCFKNEIREQAIEVLAELNSAVAKAEKGAQ